MTESQKAASARYKAKKRAERPQKAGRSDVVALEQRRAALNIDGPTLSRAVGKYGDWWRRIVGGQGLLKTDADKVRAELTAAHKRVEDTFNQEKP